MEHPGRRGHDEDQLLLRLLGAEPVDEVGDLVVGLGVDQLGDGYTFMARMMRRMVL